MRRLLPIALLALAACIDDLAPQYRVTDLRILGLRAEVEGSRWADAVPGDVLRLEALVANPLGRAPVEVAWFGCVPDGPGGALPCLEEQTLRDPAALASTPGVFPIGTGATISFAVPGRSDPGIARLLDLLAQLPPAFGCRRYVELGVAAVVRAGDIEEVAVKRVRLTPATSEPAPAYVRNANPTGLIARRAATEDCRFSEPVELAPFPAAKTFLCGFADEAAPQRFNLCDSAGPSDTAEESLDWQWYVTAGEFPEVGGVGNATGDSPEFEAPGVPFTLWLILRDGRGGVAWGAYPGLAVAP